MKVKDVVYCGVITALLCVLSPIAIPIYGIPYTLATLVLYITASLFKLKISLVAVIVYISIGCMGLPVFAGYTGGIAYIIGPTGGFILGYILLVVTTSLFDNGKYKRIIGMITGTFLMYILGCIVFMLNTDNNIFSVLSICVLPFLPVDAVKIITTVFLIPKLKKVLMRK